MGRLFISTFVVSARGHQWAVAVCRELCLKSQNIDPIKELIPVRPVVHFTDRGRAPNIHGAISLSGPLPRRSGGAVSINGADRLARIH